MNNSEIKNFIPDTLTDKMIQLSKDEKDAVDALQELKNRTPLHVPVALYPYQKK